MLDRDFIRGLKNGFEFVNEIWNWTSQAGEISIK